MLKKYRIAYPMLKITKKRKGRDEAEHALRGKISKNDHDLNYFDLVCLGVILDLFLLSDGKIGVRVIWSPTQRKFTL